MHLLQVFIGQDMLYKSFKITLITSSNHFTGDLSTKYKGFHLLTITQTRLSRPYSLHSCNHFASEGRAKIHKARPKGDYQLDIVTVWIWKGDTHFNI